MTAYLAELLVLRKKFVIMRAQVLVNPTPTLLLHVLDPGLPMQEYIGLVMSVLTFSLNIIYTKDFFILTLLENGNVNLGGKQSQSRTTRRI